MDKSLIWWTGVVESRDDPEKLGRCKVRIFGYHTEDLTVLPTKNLPWAIPMQPITSAATSGVGSTPVGIVTGSWVIGFFLDGKEAQRPVIMGTIAGKPKAEREASLKIKQDSVSANVITDSYGNIVYDNNGVPLRRADATDNNYFAPLLQSDITLILNAISNELSGGDYAKEGEDGELGKYQFNAATLINLGYVSRPPGGLVDNTILDNSSYWTGKNGIVSKTSFLNSSSVQEQIAQDQYKRIYDTLVRQGKINETDERATVGGLIASGFIVGTKNADKLDKKTPTGEKARAYFILANKALGGNAEEFFGTFSEAETFVANKSTTNLTNEDLAKITGFKDPNKKYPKYEYTGLSDINKLAIGDRSHLSLQIKDNKRVEEIPLAQSAQTWDEPEPAFGGVYPYNQVIETEAGHVIELDSTPNAERIHVFHKSGSYIEIDVNGTSVRKVVGENYEVFDRNNFVYVKGAKTLTVEGKTSILVKDDCNITVEGDLDVTTNGQALVQAAGNLVGVGENVLVTASKGMDIVSGGPINMQGTEINMYAKSGSVSVKGSKDVNLQSGTGGVVSIKGGLAILLDAIIVKTKMGANLIRALALDTLTPPNKKSPNKEQIPVLQRRTVNEDTFLFDGGEREATDWRNSREAAGEISNDISLYPKQSDLAGIFSQTNGREIILTGNCAACEKFNNSFPRSFKLSKNFSLNNLLVGKYGSALVAQRGLQEKEIVCNLIQLAENCLEPIKAKYPDMLISSGFRVGSNGSDHNIGAAADIVFPNRPLSEVKNIAEWVTQNVPFRQCLLEYETYEGSNKIRVAWIHIAFLAKDGNLIRSSKQPVQTFINHASVYSRLVNLA